MKTVLCEKPVEYKNYQIGNHLTLLHPTYTSWLDLSAQKHSSDLKSITVQQTTHVYASLSLQKPMKYKTVLKIEYNLNVLQIRVDKNITFCSAAKVK